MGKKWDGSLDLMDKMEIKYVNFISYHVMKYRKIYDNHKNIIRTIISIPVILLLIYIFYTLNASERINLLSALGTILAAVVSLNLGLGNFHAKLGTNIDISKEHGVYIDIFNKNRSSSCYLRFKKIEFTSKYQNRRKVVIDERFIESDTCIEINGLYAVNSNEYAKIPLVDRKENIDLINGLINYAKNLKLKNENIEEFQQWLNSPDVSHEFFINITFERNDDLNDISVEIPIRKLIDKGCIQ
ncbi:MAG: hypothetical protein M3012_03990 [Staphylococcus epidermidis]|nr:hypothetical protein [Staphylococcus epidermidis]